jgi:hypothetical protein
MDYGSITLDAAALGLILQKSGLPHQECWQLVGFELRIVVNPTLFGRCEIVDGWRIMQRKWTSSIVDHIFAAPPSCHSIELGPSPCSRPIDFLWSYKSEFSVFLRHSTRVDGIICS